MSHLAFATHDDETTVRALTTHLEHSWNANDGFQYASVFTEDSDYIAFDGTHLKGRRANAEHHDRLFRSVLAGSRLMFDGVTVRFLAPTVALMHGDGSVMMPWQATIAPSRRSRQTYVVVKESDTWRIAAFQNVRVRPLAVPRGLGLRVLLAFFRLRTAVAARTLRRHARSQHAHVPGPRVS
jgi:uncharacterized protein (TIGR02246 family)